MPSDRQPQTHPCFFAAAKGRYGRIHLPVAPTCNISCAYCRRDLACPHENRPGVSQGVLGPEAALERLNQAVARMPYIRVAGIAGPGDAFCDPTLTLETFRLIRRQHPDIHLCVSSNGLNVMGSIPAMEALGVGFVTVTVNAVDASIGARLCRRVDLDDRTLTGLAAAQALLERQLAAIETLVARRFTVKVNCVVVPGINDTHIPLLAQHMGRLGVDLLNLLPLIPVPGTPLAQTPPPTAELIRRLRRTAGAYLPQMTHCTRCRADAIGLLGEPMPDWQATG